jgi:hypothetical protein
LKASPDRTAHDHHQPYDHHQQDRPDDDSKICGKETDDALRYQLYNQLHPKNDHFFHTCSDDASKE